MRHAWVDCIRSIGRAGRDVGERVGSLEESGEETDEPFEGLEIADRLLLDLAHCEILLGSAGAGANCETSMKAKCP